MITIFKDKTDIPEGKNYIELNDVFFNQNTVMMLDERADQIIERIDDAKRLSKYKICSRFDDVALDIDRLSAGCKTALNVLYNPDTVFCLKECGDNALEIIFTFERGAVYSDYPMIPFDMTSVTVLTKTGSRIIDDYEELKEWWNHEK